MSFGKVIPELNNALTEIGREFKLKDKPGNTIRKALTEIGEGLNLPERPGYKIRQALAEIGKGLNLERKPHVDEFVGSKAKKAEPSLFKKGVNWVKSFFKKAPETTSNKLKSRDYYRHSVRTSDGGRLDTLTTSIAKLNEKGEQTVKKAVNTTVNNAIGGKTSITTSSIGLLSAHLNDLESPVLKQKKIIELLKELPGIVPDKQAEFFVMLGEKTAQLPTKNKFAVNTALISNLNKLAPEAQDVIRLDHYKLLKELQSAR